MPEIIVDFSEKSNGKMLINLNFNESLSIERKLKEKIIILIQITS